MEPVCCISFHIWGGVDSARHRHGGLHAIPESLTMAVLVSFSSLAIATLLGVVLVTWMSGKMTKMNTTAIFVALLFWAGSGACGGSCSPFRSWACSKCLPTASKTCNLWRSC